jgi:hypothetical protein
LRPAQVSTHLFLLGEYYTNIDEGNPPFFGPPHVYFVTPSWGVAFHKIVDCTRTRCPIVSSFWEINLVGIRVGIVSLPRRRVYVCRVSGCGRISSTFLLSLSVCLFQWPNNSRTFSLHSLQSIGHPAPTPASLGVALQICLCFGTDLLQDHSHRLALVQAGLYLLGGNCTYVLHVFSLIYGQYFSLHCCFSLNLSPLLPHFLFIFFTRSDVFLGRISIQYMPP